MKTFLLWSPTVGAVFNIAILIWNFRRWYKIQSTVWEAQLAQQHQIDKLTITVNALLKALGLDIRV